MRKTLLTVALILFSVEFQAQSLDELKGKSKITSSERQRKYSSSSYYKSSGIDWDVADETWGISYNYSKGFPVGISFSYTMNHFYIGGDLGVNLKKEKYTLKNNETKIEKGDPVLYLSASPGFYMKYFSVSCGVGFLLDSREATISSSNGSTNTKDLGYSFFAKPAITGYIPIDDDDWFVTLNLGYDICPKFKSLNGISLGIGFQVTM